MTIILFLVDSSASMAQRNYMGCSAIDTAKSIVQDILKLRQRDINNRQTDRYMLFSTEEFPACVKAGWKEGSGIFHDQLKALRPCGKFPLKQALLSALHFVNLNRAQTGVDYYGHGRFPYLQESVILIMISDGSGVADLPSDFELRFDPKKSAPGAEFTEEAFRWDQRVFSIVLRMGARSPAEPRIAVAAPVSLEPGVIQRVCAATGGRSFSMSSHKQQSAVIESLTQMIHVNGIVLRFEYPAPDLLPRNGQSADNGDLTDERKAELAGDALRKSLEERPITFVLTRNRTPGHWPIPEAFWPEAIQTSPRLPVRKAHPMLTIGVKETEAQVNTDFPFDKFELDSVCALSDFVRERTTAIGNPNVCWQVFVSNSNQTPGPGKPFGFLKTATNGTIVNLFLMPYNYPVLLKLLDEQKADVRVRGHPEWRLKLDQYIRSCPSYYKQTLKKAFARIKLTGGALDDPPPYNPHLYAPQLNKTLTTVKTAGKEEMDKLLAEIGSRLAKPPLPHAQLYRVNVEKRELTGSLKNFRIEWEEERQSRLDAAKSGGETKEQPRRRNRRLPMPTANNSASTVVIEDDIAPDPELPETAPAAPESIPNMTMELFALAGMSKVYTNPFHIEKSQLAEMLPRLRVNLEQQISDSPIPALEGGLPGMCCKLQTAYELHSQFVAQMGNYDEYVKALEAIGGGPLREVEHRAVRENTFGNPFKKDKKSLAVDEVGEAPAAARENATTGLSKKDRRAMESNRPPRRKAGPLALNSMQVWRERRRTNSMSTVSDLSHTAEDLTDDISESEANTTGIAGLDIDDISADLAALGGSSSSSSLSSCDTSASKNGADNSKGATSPAKSTASSDSGMSAWGLEDEAEEDEDDDDVLVVEPTPAKKAKIDNSTPSSSSTAHRRPRIGGEEATLEKVRGLKGEVVRVVRMFLSDEAMFSKIEALLAPLSMRALLIMTRFARDEAKRFKKRALTTTLQQRLDELEAVESAMI